LTSWFSCDKLLSEVEKHFSLTTKRKGITEMMDKDTYNKSEGLDGTMPEVSHDLKDMPEKAYYSKAVLDVQHTLTPDMIENGEVHMVVDMLPDVEGVNVSIMVTGKHSERDDVRMVKAIMESLQMRPETVKTFGLDLMLRGL
jgi:hypothetical protein